MKRAFIYSRVSTADQSNSLQIKELTDYCQRQGWTIVRIFQDKATGSNANRESFKEMNDLIFKKKADVLVVFKLDRIFRSLRDAVIHLQEWNDQGIEFISVRDPGIGLGNATSRLMTHILFAFSEFELSLIRQRVKSGIENAKAKGVKLGRPKRSNQQLLLSLRAQGMTLKEIGKQVGLTESAVSKALKSLE